MWQSFWKIDVTLVAWCFFSLKKFEIYIFVLSKKSPDTFFVLLMLVFFVKFMAFNWLEFSGLRDFLFSLTYFIFLSLFFSFSLLAFSPKIFKSQTQPQFIQNKTSKLQLKYKQTNKPLILFAPKIKPLILIYPRLSGCVVNQFNNLKLFNNLI